MSLLSKTISNLFNGVSQQPTELRDDSQATVQLNAVSSPAYGLRKRPGTKTLARMSDTTTDPLVHFINRDDSEKYAVTIDNGTIKVFDAQTGAGVPVSTPNGTEYLKTANPQQDLRLVTVADYTFVTNTRQAVHMTADLAAAGDNQEASITFPVPAALTTPDKVGQNTNWYGTPADGGSGGGSGYEPQPDEEVPTEPASGYPVPTEPVPNLNALQDGDYVVFRYAPMEIELWGNAIEDNVREYYPFSQPGVSYTFPRLLDAYNAAITYGKAYRPVSFWITLVDNNAIQELSRIKLVDKGNDILLSPGLAAVTLLTKDINYSPRPIRIRIRGMRDSYEQARTAIPNNKTVGEFVIDARATGKGWFTERASFNDAIIIPGTDSVAPLTGLLLGPNVALSGNLSYRAAYFIPPLFVSVVKKDKYVAGMFEPTAFICRYSRTAPWLNYEALRSKMARENFDSAQPSLFSYRGFTTGSKEKLDANACGNFSLFVV